MRDVRSATILVSLFVALTASTAQAQTTVLLCTLGGDPSTARTYYVDTGARTVTTDAHNMNGTQQVFPAQITDQAITYYVGGDSRSFVTIDRYSLVMRNPLNTFQCTPQQRRIP